MFILEYDRIELAKFDLTLGNFPGFMLGTRISGVCMCFSVVGVRIVQAGGEIDLGNGSLRLMCR